MQNKNYSQELSSIYKYVNLLRNNSFPLKKYNYKIIKPKITFIVSVYNKEKYLKSLILSIQNQMLKDFELILVDDSSTDKSIQIIKKFQKIDKRIQLIENKKNKGTLFTRYRGALFAKGEYLIFIDSDDIVLPKGINNAYNYISQNNIDMIQFHSVFEYKGKIYINNKNYYSKIIYQPILSYIFYYRNNEGYEYNTALWDKLINKKIVLKSLKYLGNKYLNEKIIIENDVPILFSLFINSNSFKYVEELGYYYVVSNNDSITNTRYQTDKAEQIMHSIFTNINYFYEKSGNTYLDKYFCIFKLKQGYERYKMCFKYLNDEIYFIRSIIDKLLHSRFISSKNKLFIYKIKNLLIYLKKKNMISIIFKFFQ